MSNKTFFSKKEFSYILFFLKKNFLNYKFLSLNNTTTSFTFFNFVDFFKSLLNIFFWAKIRVLYYVNNWIYTTNHKRIAVNYFWFVILSGIVGMVLATLIRLEFAYPGVGIFAGDSLQYLSMATAHGVIMVFFMIMPLLFGAFANFLIPTQLGVHDVAFPRLNSAAFWFLPGGLLMLCQLVCIDRRYQRMNCFNIREIQSILKRKFFTDLINTHDHHILLDKTAMGLRFKTNNINSINNNIFVFYNYGIEYTAKIRSSSYVFNTFDSNLQFINNKSSLYFFITNFSNFNIFFLINTLFLNFSNISLNLTYFSEFFKNLSLSIYDSIVSLAETLFFNFFFLIDFFYEIIDSFFNFFKNFNNFIFLFLYSINFFLDSFTKNFIEVFFSNKEIFKNIFLNITFSNNLTFNFPLYGNFNISLFFKNFLYEFFFFINFLEIFFFYNTSSHFFSSFTFFSQIYGYFYNIFMALKNFLNINSFFNNNTDKKSPLYIKNLTTDDSLLINKSFTSKTFSPYFNNSFNYDSYFIYFYTFFNFLLNLPLFFFNFFKNIFNLNYLISSFFYVYEYFSLWYVPALFELNFSSLTLLTFNFFEKINLTFIGQIYVNLINFIQSIFNYFGKIYLISHNKINLQEFFSYFVYFFITLYSNFIFFFVEIYTSIILILNNILFSYKTNSVHSYFYNAFFNNQIFNNFTTSNYDNKRFSYSSKYFNNLNNPFFNKYSNEESSSNSRYLRFYNPVFKYDYKSGDYFPKLYKEMYTSLFTTISELTSGLRTSSWFLSDKYLEAFNANFNNYYDSILNTNTFPGFNIHSWSSSRFNNTDPFFNFFYVLSTDSLFTNKKWISLNTLNQKFYKMFNTSSMQQRIYSNWRQLKFTREAWRCKLLAARHQKTLFRRYINEDGVFWSIERNAKDLLPGWAMITPFSARTRYTAVGKTDIGLMGVFLVLNSSIISGANFLVTYRYLSTLNNRKMRDARVFFTESIIVACWMMIFANPMLAIAILMLLSDRHWQTSFFDYSGGGDTVLFQHMFWFFGHPEVYVIIIPTFGFTNSMISYYLKKRVSARASLMYSMYTIAFLGFFVWGHHMYMVGLAHTTRMLFSTLTVMISVPAATKIMHWCVTTVNSAISVELPLLFTFTFIFLFVSGGISGMCVAHTGMDVLFHDTFYVIGHFHVMLAGAAMFGSFGGFYFYFPAIFGVKYSRIYAYLHYVYYLLGQLMTVIPMFWLGYAGMPRRVLDYPASMGGWHSVISAGHMLSVAGLMAFFIMIFDSLRQGRAVTRNTFGISRYNTLLNFYLYETSRLIYVQQKGLTLFRFTKPSSIKLNNSNYLNFEPFETTLITYTFSDK